MKDLINTIIDSQAVRSDWNAGSVEQRICNLPLTFYGDIKNQKGRKLNCRRLQKWGYRPVLERVTDGVSERDVWFHAVGLADEHGHLIQFRDSYGVYAPLGRELWEQCD